MLPDLGIPSLRQIQGSWVSWGPGHNDPQSKPLESVGVSWPAIGRALSFGQAYE